MAKSTIYAGLEIGTNKICVVVGEVKPDGAIKILGVGQAPSRGVRKGEIFDDDPVKVCLHDALVRAEDLSDVMIRNVFLAATGAHVRSMNNRGTLHLPEDQSEITEDDLKEVKEIARDVEIPSDHVFMHSIVQQYHVDGQDRVLNPVGKIAQQLEADYHIIYGIRNRVENAIKVVREIPLEVEDVVFSGIASAQVVLGREAKQQGALLIDIGAGTSDYVLYTDGVVTESVSVGGGGAHLTNDIGLVLKVPPKQADYLKCEIASADPNYEPSPEEEEVTLEPDTSFEGRSVERSLLNAICRARCGEAFNLIKRKTAENGFLERAGDGVTLTGGSSKLKGIDKLAEEIFQMPVHCASSQPVSGLAATYENPTYATAIGLIRYAQIVDSQHHSGPRWRWLSKVFGQQPS